MNRNKVTVFLKRLRALSHTSGLQIASCVSLILVIYLELQIQPEIKIPNPIIEPDNPNSDISNPNLFNSGTIHLKKHRYDSTLIYQLFQPL